MGDLNKDFAKNEHSFILKEQPKKDQNEKSCCE